MVVKLERGEANGTCVRMVEGTERRWQPCGAPAAGRSDAGALLCRKHLDPITDDREEG